MMKKYLVKGEISLNNNSKGAPGKTTIKLEMPVHASDRSDAEKRTADHVIKLSLNGLYHGYVLPGFGDNFDYNFEETVEL